MPTPAHAMGYMSVVLNDKGYTYFFVGDPLCDLLNGTLDTPIFNSDVTLATRRNISELVTATALVYLSTHDPRAASRLNSRKTVYGSRSHSTATPGRMASIETQSPSVRTLVT